MAGEPSGDYLGGGLIRELARRYPDAQFEGIGGEHMIAAGLTSHYALHQLSVMGLVEVLRHLPRLLGIRRALKRRWREDPPDLFIGVDAPDFNLGLARALSKQGVPTVQYVSPTVWAWREGRLRGIRRSVDRILCIYPFEDAYFARHGIDSRFVGHPLADEIPLEIDSVAARQRLGVDEYALLVALLPGSRRGEIDRLMPLFRQIVAQVASRRPGCQFLVPAATPALEARIRALLEPEHGLPVRVVSGQAREVLAAANAGLVASGTATLEAMLLRCPALMTYRVNALTAALARRSLRIPYFAMPNLMAGEMLMPEFVQEQANAEAITPALEALLDEPARRAALGDRFADLHRQLRCHAAARAAEAVEDLLVARRAS